ncbi:MAG: hypothetical protein PHH96_08790, partial [Smithellaceae bacterium]|nr:hypothetical protein [Smithellaceae bacterium]
SRLLGKLGSGTAVHAFDIDGGISSFLYSVDTISRFIGTGDDYYDAVDQGDDLEIAGIRKAILDGGNLLVQNKTKGTTFEASCLLSTRQKQIILAGGALNVRGQK